MSKFWQVKKLHEMSEVEWESICDGCGKCCLQKLECEDTGEVFYTDVACKLLDLETCNCMEYSNRASLVPECLKLDKNNIDQWSFLPGSCSYRLLSESKPLPNWHPLIKGDRSEMLTLGCSVSGRVLPETAVCEDDLESHLVTWV